MSSANLNKKIIISDAGPLIALARIKRIDILSQTLGDIIIPEAVASECTLDKLKPGANLIQKAIDSKIVEVHPSPPIHTYQKWSALLGPGESAAMILAKKLSSPLFIDEKLGRKIAITMNIQVIGTAGLLLLAKKAAIIPAIKPLLTLLKKEGYYLSAVLEKEILIKASEKSET